MSPHRGKRPAGGGGLDAPRAGRMAFVALILASAAVILADIFYEKHAHYAWEQRIGFHAGYAFAACFVLALAARALRLLVERDDGYHDRDDR